VHSRFFGIVASLDFVTAATRRQTDRIRDEQELLKTRTTFEDSCLKSGMKAGEKTTSMPEFGSKKTVADFKIGDVLRVERDSTQRCHR
jgi:hypothetical protein